MADGQTPLSPLTDDVASAPDKLAELVDFVALRFAQLRPDGDPSSVAEQLVKLYAFQKSSTFTALQELDRRYSDEHAAEIIERAYMSSDGIIDGKLEEQRAAKELEEIRRREEVMLAGATAGEGTMDTATVARRVGARMQAARLGVELCSAHFTLITWLRLHSSDASGHACSLQGVPVSTPWREVDLAPCQARLDACVAAAEALDGAPASAVVARCKCLLAVRRDIARVRQTLPLVPVLNDLGKDPSLAPANVVWAALLGLGDFAFEHQRVNAVREHRVPKMCLCHILHLLQSAPSVREELWAVHQEQQKKADEARAEAAAQAAAAEKKRADEERRAATAANRRNRDK